MRSMISMDIKPYPVSYRFIFGNDRKHYFMRIHADIHRQKNRDENVSIYFRMDKNQMKYK